MTGSLISVEGIDFAGKTTQVNLLHEVLAQHGYSPIVFKFPDRKMESGRLLLDVVQGHRSMQLHALFALFSVNRLEHKETIDSAYFAGQVVLLDRYSESEYAYGAAKGLPTDWLVALESQMRPAGLVLVLDVDPLFAMARDRPGPGRDKFEQDTSFLVKVREHYLRLASQPPRANQQWQVIDASQNLSVVHRAVVEHVWGFLRERK